MHRPLPRMLLFCACLTLGLATAAAQYYPNLQHGPKRTLAPGVTWWTATNASPALSIQVIEVDMTNRNIELMPVFRSGGNELGLSNERTSSMAARVDAVAAINAGYRSTDGTNLTNSYTVIDGQFIGGSGTAMHPENNRSVLGFSGDHQSIAKRTKLSSSFVPADPADWEKIIDGIAGRGHFVTSGGVLVTQDNESTTASHHGNRHPRTAIGFSEDPYRVWLVTVDGRQSGFSVGMTYLELGRLMADLGIEQSISLDGGGSTTTWIKGEGVVNSPSDGSERPVISAWAVVPANTMHHSVEEMEASGNWHVGDHAEKYYLNDLTTSSTTVPGSAEWRPNLARDGLYRIYAWWTSGVNRATKAPYRINHHAGTRVVEVNQRENGGRWYPLAQLPFGAGTDGSVVLENTDPGIVSANALRFVFVRDQASYFWKPTDWTTIALDVFGNDPIAFDPLVRDPADSSGGNSRWERNFDYTGLSGPSIPIPPGGNGLALATAANNASPGTEQILYQTFGSGDTEDSAVEALLLGYLADNNTAGSTTWGGIGIRMSDDFRNGYFVQHRVDDSASLGNYVNFFRIQDGNTLLLGRYYYRVGSSGVTDGVIGDSRAIRSPEEAATNQWVPIRLEATGDSIVLFVEDMESPVTIYKDPAPLPAGKAVLYHQDPFGNSLTSPANSSGTFFEYFKVEVPADAAAPGENTPALDNLEEIEGGGVRVRFTATPNRTYVVEASHDLEEWTPLPDTYTTDENGQVVVEDPEAGLRRFWRLRLEEE